MITLHDASLILVRVIVSFEALVIMRAGMLPVSAISFLD